MNPVQRNEDEIVMANEWQRLAYGNRPPASPRKNEAGLDDPPGGLTPVFNHAVGNNGSGPPPLTIDRSKLAATTQKKIADLRSKMSQPKPTLEPSPLGSVNRAISTDRDRKLAAKAAAFQAMLSGRLGNKNDGGGMGPTTSKYLLTRNFNKASLGRSL